MTRRNFTESTTRAYVRIIQNLALYFNRPPDQLEPEHIREYTAHLFRDRKLSDNTVNQTVGALRFFFLKTLKRPWRSEEMPFPKKRIHLPVIWSPDEVGHLIGRQPAGLGCDAWLGGSTQLFRYRKRALRSEPSQRVDDRCCPLVRPHRHQ